MGQKMLKTVGLVLVVLCCSGCGAMMAANLRRRMAALQKTQLFLHLLSERLSYTLCPVQELFAELAGEPLLRELDYIAACSRRLQAREPFPEALRESVLESRLPLNERDREVLVSLCPIIGASDVENQLSGLALIRANLSGQAGQAREQVQRRARLYRSLGVLAGAAMAILLL